MNKDEEKFLSEVFESVRPYLAYPSEFKDKMEEVFSKSSSIGEIESRFETLIAEENDPSLKSDYRIFLNKLKTR